LHPDAGLAALRDDRARVADIAGKGGEIVERDRRAVRRNFTRIGNAAGDDLTRRKDDAIFGRDRATVRDTAIES
jgi:hypothetical protein